MVISCLKGVVLGLNNISLYTAGTNVAAQFPILAMLSKVQTFTYVLDTFPICFLIMQKSLYYSTVCKLLPFVINEDTTTTFSNFESLIHQCSINLAKY